MAFLDRPERRSPFFFDKAAPTGESNEAFRRALPQKKDGTIVNPETASAARSPFATACPLPLLPQPFHAAGKGGRILLSRLVIGVRMEASARFGDVEIPWPMRQPPS